MSRVTAIISALLSASSSACHGLLIITVITPLPTKPSDKNARELLANAAITDMQMRQRDVAALDAKYTKELADAKAENDALRDDVAAGRRRLHIVICQSVREATTASGVDNAASPDWQTPLNGIISHPQREADHYAKQRKEPRSILMSSVDRVAHTMGNLGVTIVSNTHALPAEYKNAQSIKTGQSIYECLLGFCFNNIFCAATNFGCIDSFLRPIPETKK